MPPIAPSAEGSRSFFKGEFIILIKLFVSIGSFSYLYEIKMG